MRTSFRCSLPVKRRTNSERDRPEDPRREKADDKKDRVRQERQAKENLAGPHDGDREAKQGEPQVFGVFALGKVECKTQNSNTEKQEAHSDSGGELFIPVAACGGKEPFCNVVLVAKLNLGEQAARDGQVGTRPGADRQNDAAAGGRARQVRHQRR